MQQPLVSIIMPVYNGTNYLGKAIRSVLSQTYANYELIIVDDGSIDGSRAVIEEFSDNKNIHYIYQTNAGVAAARNTGIATAQGEFVALLDQDDLWLPHKLLKQVQFMLDNPDIGLLHTAISCINENDQPMSCENMIWVGDYDGWCTAKLLGGNGIAPLTILARMELLKNCGGFVQARAPADDWDLWLRMSRLAKLGFLPEICAYYRIHACNESKNLLKMKWAEIAVLEDYLADFRLSMTAKEKYVAERALVKFCQRAAIIARTQGNLKEAEAFQSKIPAIIHNGSIWHYRDYLAELLVPPGLRKRVSWYSYRLLNLIKHPS